MSILDQILICIVLFLHMISAPLPLMFVDFFSLAMFYGNWVLIKYLSVRYPNMSHTIQPYTTLSLYFTNDFFMNEQIFDAIIDQTELLTFIRIFIKYCICMNDS